MAIDDNSKFLHLHHNKTPVAPLQFLVASKQRNSSMTTMRILIWITIFAHGTLRLRGDGDATRTLSFSNRGQRRMQSSEDAREPLDDFNLFRRDSYQSDHDNEVEDITLTDYYSSSHDAEQVSESEPPSGKGKGKSSKDSGKGKGKSSSSKSLKSSKKDKLSSKKKSKSSHSFKKKKHGKGHMNHVSGKGKGHTHAPSASHHHSSKSHISGKGKGGETLSPVSSPHSSLSQSPVNVPSPSSPSSNSPNVTPTPPAASGPTASPSGKSLFLFPKLFFAISHSTQLPQHPLARRCNFPTSF